MAENLLFFNAYRSQSVMNGSAERGEGEGEVGGRWEGGGRTPMKQQIIK